MKIKYLHYSPQNLYEGTIPTDPVELKRVIEEQFDIDAKKIVADLINKNTGDTDHRGLYYNPKLGFIGYIKVPRGGTLDKFKDYSFILKTKEVYTSSSSNMSEVVSKINELTYSKENIDEKLEQYAKTSDLPNLSPYLTQTKAEEVYAKKTDIPTNVERLTQEQADGRYAKKADIPDTSSFITSQNAEQTYAKKSEIPNISSKLDSSVAESTYAKKSEIPNVSQLATKSEVQSKADSSALQSAVTSLQNEITTKISQASSEGVSRSYVKNFTKASNVSSATIYFSSGVNFYLDNPSGGSVLKAGDLGNPDNFGKSGLVYINGSSIQSLAPDFAPINPDEATFSKGYVFFSYFFHPIQKKIIVQYLKDSTR